MTADFIARLLAVDKTLQGALLMVNSLALMLTLRLCAEAWRDWRNIRGNGSTEAQRTIAWQGVRSQTIIATVQTMFLIVTASVLTLPEIPLYAMGTHITQVIAARKALRALMIFVLAYHSWTSHQTRVKVLAMLSTSLRAH